MIRYLTSEHGASAAEQALLMAILGIGVVGGALLLAQSLTAGMNISRLLMETAGAAVGGPAAAQQASAGQDPAAVPAAAMSAGPAAASAGKVTGPSASAARNAEGWGRRARPK